LNPFTIGIAQGLSNLPLFSGIEYRLFVWLVINVVGIGWVLRYASRIKKNPDRSPVYQSDTYWRDKEHVDLNSLQYHTPVSAWITFFILLAGMVVFAIFEPSTTLHIGNSEYTFWF